MKGSVAEKIRLLVVDDQHIVVEGLRTIVAETDDLTIVAETSSVEEAKRMMHDLRPAVVLVDICIGERSGLDVCRYARDVHPEISSVALTAGFDDELLHAALDAGVSGYLLTQARCTDLVEAVRHVAAGDAVLDPAVTRRMVELLQDGPTMPPAVEGLSARKRRLLRLVAEDRGTAEIAASEFISEKTVRNQLSLLVQDLGLANRDELTTLAKTLHQPTLRWSALI